MSDPSPTPPVRPVFPQLAAALGVVTVLAGIVWVAWRSLPAFVGFGDGARTSGHRVARDVYADSPYRNARPGVAHVGDEACFRCHREIVEAYRAHPMGRSLAPVGADAPAHGTVGLPIDAQGFRYAVEHRNGRVFHKESRLDARGKVLAEVEGEVRFAVGSGTRGIAYLVEREGFLFQSPIAWYAQDARWDLAPGYRADNPHFERPIEPGCLFCHANHVRPVAGTANRYETPVFREHAAIGCERCHGPGALHVKSTRDRLAMDLTIVNPARLAPALRDAVCQQCHLQGALRFPRASRETFDFRPGLPFHRFWAVFFKKAEGGDEFEAVGHVEQMETSRCFRASQGQLGCISCHDPHRLPARSERVAYYRDRCLECHADKGCSLPESERRSRGRVDDCVACHMPRPRVTNIPHTAATDHRIARGTPSTAPKGLRETLGQSAETFLADYQLGQLTAAERQAAERDRGVALSMAAWLMRAARAQARTVAALAQPPLEAAARDRPDDLPAGEALATTQALLGRYDDALRTFEAVLEREPHRESSLRSTALLLADVNQPERARRAWEKLLAIDPLRSSDHLAMAQICAQLRDWPAAIAACRQALQLNPALIEARSLLVQACLRAGQSENADSEFQTLIAFHPASREVWQQWFDWQKAEARDGRGKN